MYTHVTHRKTIVLGLLVAFFVTLASSWYIHTMQSRVLAATQQKIAQQEEKLKVLTAIIAQDGANATVENIVRDCSSENRVKFDMQLGLLPQLRGAQLYEIEQLFNACGNFFAQRKAVMTAFLEREFEVYLELIEILSLFDSRANSVAYDVDGWGKRVALETQRSLLTTKLVEIQGTIIRALLHNVPITSDDMQATLVEGQKVKDELITLSSQIGELQSRVPTL